MFFYLYLDPEVICFAEKNGAPGFQALISLLRNCVHNCFLVDFTDSRIQNQIEKEVEELPSPFDRVVLKKIVGILVKRNRFILCLTPDYESNESDIHAVKRQAAQALLDLLVLADDCSGHHEGVELASLFTYQNTDFENRRSSLAHSGVTLLDGELGQVVFLDRFLKKALKFARTIEIWDKLLGQQYKANYEYTLRIWFEWLKQILDNPEGCKLVFHCGVPDDEKTLASLQRCLANLKLRLLPDCVVKLQLYEAPTRSDPLPHHRYLITNQVAIGIDRGMDFLNKATRRNRNLSLDYKSNDELLGRLRDYTGARLPEIEF